MEKKWLKEQKEKMKKEVDAVIVKIIKFYLLHYLVSHKYPKDDDVLTNIVNIRNIKGVLRSCHIELDEWAICHFLKDLMFGPDRVAEFNISATGTSRSIIFYKISDLEKDPNGHD